MSAPLAAIYACLQGLQSLSTRNLDTRRICRRELHREQLLRRSLVNQFFQFLAGFEIGDTFGRNTHRVACLGVTTPAGATLAHAKAAETTQLNLLALVQTLDY